MAYVKWTREKLEEIYTQQLGFLERSCRDYDEGHWPEAFRLALTLRVLVHDTKDSTSLMTQLGLMDGLVVLHTAKHDTKWVRNGDFEIAIEAEYPDGTSGFMNMNQDGLAEVGLVDGARTYLPLFQADPQEGKMQPFPDWWKLETMDLPNGNKYSRRSLVMQLAHKAGGGHVDPKGVEEGYALLEEMGLGIAFAPGAEYAADPSGAAFEPPLGSVVFASMRQIAYEFLRSAPRLPIH